MSNPITIPFGVEGVGSAPEDLTTITQLAHPVMNGRFGVVDSFLLIPDGPSKSGAVWTTDKKSVVRALPRRAVISVNPVKKASPESSVPCV